MLGIRVIAVWVSSVLLLAGAAATAIAGDPSAGSLDKSFSYDGKRLIGFGPQVRASAADVLVHRGRILSVGEVQVDPHVFGRTSFALARQLPNGDEDGDFGVDGKVTTEWALGSARAQSVARYGSNKLIVAGDVNSEGGQIQNFAVARYHWDGSLDETFGEGGKVVTDLDVNSDQIKVQYVTDVRVRSDGRILVVGMTEGNPTGSFATVVRYNPDGSVDETFGEDGFATAEKLGNGAVLEVAELLPDGGFVAAGYFSDATAVARYDSDGKLDPTFGGGDGYTITPTGLYRGFEARDIAIDPTTTSLSAGKWKTPPATSIASSGSTVTPPTGRSTPVLVRTGSSPRGSSDETPS